MINIDHSDNSLLITKVPTKTSQEEIEYRYPPEYGKVTIGRDKNCTISFSINKNLSKVNTTIFFNSDEKSFGGSGKIEQKIYNTKKLSSHGKEYSLTIDIPKLTCMYFIKENKN